MSSAGCEGAWARLMVFFRAVFTKAKVQKGQNVLITGIGGGVAITALQYAVALGTFPFAAYEGCARG